MPKKRKAKSSAKASELGAKKTKEALIAIAVIIAVILLLFLFYPSAKPEISVLAKVNGVEIVRQDLDEIALTIPPQARMNVTESDLLEQAINFEIIRQEAEKIGIIVTDEEAEKNINSSLESAGMSIEQLKDSISQQNIEWSQLFDAYKKQILSYKFINETIIKNITVNESEIRDFYDLYSGELNVSYSDARENIRNAIIIAESQQMLSEWLAQKRTQYSIERYG